MVSQCGSSSSSSSSSSSRTTKGYSKTLNIPLLHGGGGDGGGGDDISLSFESKQLNLGEGSSERSSRSSTPIVDSVAVESAREKLLLGLISKEEFVQVIAADASKSMLENAMDVEESEESEEISPPLPPRARQPGLDSVTADDVEEWV